MLMTISEANNSNIEIDKSDSEAMPGDMNCYSQSLLSTKRSAFSLTEAETSNMTLGAGPLWWS